MTTATARMSTAELNDLLHAHCIKPEDRMSAAGAGAVYLTEVTAPGGTRRADAVHIGLWQSRGAGRIEVFELKTSRSDFLRELNSPAKAEAWWPYSTTFSIVVPSTGIASVDELPPGWGLLVPQPGRRRFRTVVKPAEREPHLTVGLLLTLLKCTETTRTHDLRYQADELARRHQQAQDKLRRELRGTPADPGARRRLEFLDLLEQALGTELDIETWGGRLSAPDTAQILQELAQGHAAMNSARQRMEGYLRQFERLTESADREAKALRKALRTDTSQEA